MCGSHRRRAPGPSNRRAGRRASPRGGNEARGRGYPRWVGSLLDPTATVESDKVTWASTTIEEGLNPSFDYNRLRLNGFQRYGTHFTTNSSDYTP